MEHLWLALIPVVVGAALALPLGYLAARKRCSYQPVNNGGAIIYSIPSLALFLMIPPHHRGRASCPPSTCWSACPSTRWPC